jgi:hypothetical protein
VQWQEAALAELGLAHNEAVIGEILALSASASEMRKPVAARSPNRW